MAPQDTKSATNCGEIGSKNSVAVGIPSCTTSSRNLRATRKPWLIENEPSSFGSLISPFQPTVVRGFRIVNRAWAHDDDDAVVFPGDNARNILPSFRDELSVGFGNRQLLHQDGGRDQRA